MNVTARERKARADRELVRRPGRTSHDHFRRKNVTGKAGQRGDLYLHEFTERAADPEMMRCDMEWYVFHDLVGFGV
jgi:hypothetical protein